MEADLYRSGVVQVVRNMSITAFGGASGPPSLDLGVEERMQHPWTQWRSSAARLAKAEEWGQPLMVHAMDVAAAFGNSRPAPAVKEVEERGATTTQVAVILRECIGARVQPRLCTQRRAFGWTWSRECATARRETQICAMGPLERTNAALAHRLGPSPRLGGSSCWRTTYLCYPPTGGRWRAGSPIISAAGPGSASQRIGGAGVMVGGGMCAALPCMLPVYPVTGGYSGLWRTLQALQAVGPTDVAHLLRICHSDRNI